MRSNGGAYSGLIEADHERGTFRVRREAYRSPEVFAKELEVLNFVTYRTKFDQTVVFMGHHIYRLEPDDRSFRIREKRCVLDFDSLSQQGKATILL